MGCDIHTYVEKRSEGGFVAIDCPTPFDWRSYRMYGFLAGVRNYSAVPPLAEVRGLPDDASAEVCAEHERWEPDAHSASWLSLDELTAFDYDAGMEDRRVMINNNGGCTAPPGGGEMTTYREFLGPNFFEDIDKLKAAGADRIVFWFDN